MTNDNREKSRSAKRGKYVVDDLGCAAYLYMQGFSIEKCTSNGIFFKIDDDKTFRDITAQRLDYYNSDFARFDQCLMTIKKLRGGGR